MENERKKMPISSFWLRRKVENRRHIVLTVNKAVIALAAEPFYYRPPLSTPARSFTPRVVSRLHFFPL